jgi:hypothetical protein
LETSSTRAHAAALHGVLLEQFIASKTSRPTELVRDVDAIYELPPFCKPYWFDVDLRLDCTNLSTYFGARRHRP